METTAETTETTAKTTKTTKTMGLLFLAGVSSCFCCFMDSVVLDRLPGKAPTQSPKVLRAGYWMMLGGYSILAIATT